MRIWNLSITTLALTAVLMTPLLTADEGDSKPSRPAHIDILSETFGFTDETPAEVALSEFRQGCQERDCIPSIDSPKFVSAQEADAFLNDKDDVLALELNGEFRAYPTRIMVYHEIVNDQIGGTPVAITFCPLCGSGLAFERLVDGKPAEFGVSGLLYNSDLVMYDRTTESLWDQVEGRAIVGPKTGDTLSMIPLAVASWKDWKTAHPETKVLSIETGREAPYGEYPYSAYEKNEKIYFPVSAQDARLHPKKVVYGVNVEGRFIAYDSDLFEKKKSIKDRFQGRKLQITQHPDSSVTVVDQKTGKSYVPIRLFWFAWYTFHPDTELRLAP